MAASPVRADKLNCEQHNADGAGPSPASLTENSSQCSMSFGSSGKKNADELLAEVDLAFVERDRLDFIPEELRPFVPFDVDSSAPLFDQAFGFLRALERASPVSSQVLESNPATTVLALLSFAAGSVPSSMESGYTRAFESVARNDISGFGFGNNLVRSLLGLEEAKTIQIEGLEIFVGPDCFRMRREFDFSVKVIPGVALPQFVSRAC
jgi:hypothetical protein